MKLSMEIPVGLLEELSPLCDLDFALAHLVLENERYAEFYAQQSKNGRQIILDNSFHELGRPLPPAELKKAVERIRPWCIVAPDKLGEPAQNIQWFREMVDTLGSVSNPWIGVVMCGNTPQERHAIFDYYRNKTAVIFWPFKENRLQWFRELALVPGYQMYLQKQYHHLLGVSTIAELEGFHEAFFSYAIPEKNVSVDTSKPIKFGLKGTRITPEMDMRGSGLLDHEAIVTECTSRADILYNIAMLRRYV